MNAAKREKFLNLIGLGLLLLCFALSLGHIFGRYFQRVEGREKTVIRFSHWQLESGIREAFEHVAADYMRLHPNVRVEQDPVPETIYANWLRTQLIGGTAPELIELDTAHGETNEILSTYFEPVTPWLNEPNPYNKDNDLARTPWRETFIDGLSHAYNQELLQSYEVPNSMFTVRMFYNRPLWRTVFGSEKLPATYDEFMDCCRRAAAYRNAAGEPILPVAAYQANAPLLVQGFFCNQTERLYYSLAPPGGLTPGNEMLGIQFLAGSWNYDSPAVRDGLELARSIGQFMPAGFLERKREDALFIFSQGRALMTVAGSWDAPSLRSQAPFEVGVFPVPVPTPDNPRYGHNTAGATSEAGTGTGLNFALAKQDTPEKQARVIDFLQFLTSRSSNRIFSDDSGWLPAVIGVQPAPDVQPFLPRVKGEMPGFNMGMSTSDFGGGIGTETARVVNTSLYRLFDVDGGPAAFVQLMAEPMRAAVVSDITTINRGQLEVVMRQDTTVEAYNALGRLREADRAAKASELHELQTQEEIGLAGRRWKLAQIHLTLER